MTGMIDEGHGVQFQLRFFVICEFHTLPSRPKFFRNLWLPALRMGVLKVEWCTIYLLLLRFLLLDGQGKPCRLTTTGQRASCNEYPLGAPEHCVSLWYLFMICSSAVSSFQAEHLPN